MSHQSLNLQADDLEIDEHEGHEAEPDVEGVPRHISVIIVKVIEDAVFDLCSFAQVQNEEGGSVVWDPACKYADKDGHGPSCSKSNVWEYETCASDQGVDQSNDIDICTNGGRFGVTNICLNFTLALFMFNVILFHLHVL